ncbi:MarR family winged helix-turn-helix transcriptional regulator [Streptomyces fulvoviolaceus]|uniref:MarR family winged helix-turn-helix transcriptional regulator n=1 Tax=Streptomyces fulvoviolaceus TaxID=285535 RepID=UPI0005BE9BC4|nr:MarR family transcriptional regulator [Streptomyces fulvoviolaceus]MCT9083685.1 MarR family transcriptional regulator [Streptomyces fulvoviolaceus]
MDLKPLFTDLIRLEIELWDAVDARLRGDLDLQLRNYLALQVIGTTPSCRVYNLVERLGITVGTASKAVDRLEDAGWCLRRNNPKDRRSPILELTETGESLLDKATLSVDAELALRLASPLDGQALEQLTAAVARLVRPSGTEERTA